MTPPKPRQSETNTTTGLPDFLVVGQARAGRRNGHITVDHLRKMLGWFEAADPQLKETGSTDLGIPATKLAEELGLSAPKNGNSFRGSLQKAFDSLEVDGKTIFLSLRGCPGPKFVVSRETVLWFHPIARSERVKVDSQPSQEQPATA